MVNWLVVWDCHQDRINHMALWPCAKSSELYGPLSSACRILKRGGGGGRNFRKFERNIDQNLKLSHSDFVPFFAQNQVKSKKKRSSLEFRPIFRPKSGEEQKKKRSSLKFHPIFHPISADFEPKAWCRTCKGGGACLNFAHFSKQFCNPGDPKGGPWPNGPPPKYAPVPAGNCFENLVKTFLFFKFIWQDNAKNFGKDFLTWKVLSLQSVKSAKGCAQCKSDPDCYIVGENMTSHNWTSAMRSVLHKTFKCKTFSLLAGTSHPQPQMTCSAQHLGWILACSYKDNFSKKDCFFTMTPLWLSVFMTSCCLWL